MRSLLFLILLLLHPRGLSQEARPVECRFLSFGSNGGATSVIALSDQGAEITCPLPTTQLSKKIVCHAKGNTIPFLSADKKPLASATISPDVRSAIVVFVSTSKPSEAPAWKIFVIDDSPKNFPDGGAYVANFCSDDIRFVIGEHKGMLRTAGSNGYAMPKERDDFNMSPVIFEIRKGDKWRIANESSLRFLPGMRYLMFAYVDPVSGRPRLNTYQDLAPPAPPQRTP